MLTTLVISCCLVFIFLQLTNPYISLAKNAIKHTTTETYLISYRLANIHNIIKTISLAAYANAKYGLLLKVRYTARKLVVMTALDTLFLMALIINKGKWLLVAFLPLWYNGRRYHPYTGTERGCATMSIFSSFLLSVLASVVAYYICKWLDGDK